MYDLDATIRERYSSRMFLPKQVPQAVIDETLELATYSPSNSNTRPWQLVFATGAARERLVDALLEAAGTGTPQIPELPEEFAHYRFEHGAQLYGTLGIARDDTEGRRAALLRNWEFFGAPLAGVVCMHRDLDKVGSLGVGMFLQTLMLSLTARGLGSCVEVSIAGYPDIVRKELGIPDELTVLCGLAIGYPDPSAPVNGLRMERESVDKHVRFLAS